MKILIISQYFWPENFKINDLALGLKERGHEVSVLTGIPNYPKGEFYRHYSFWKNNDEEWNGIKISRSKIFARGTGGIRLMLNYLSFMFFCSFKVFFIKEKFDKIFVYEPSPVTVGIPAVVAGWKMKIPFYFFVQDLWPESLSAAGGIHNKLVLRFFNQLTQFIYSKAHKILVQSRGFIDYISTQGHFLDKIIYYPNTAESLFKPMIPEEEYLKKLPVGFKLLFAGNLGEAQGIGTLIKAAKIVKEKGIDMNWVFLGDGRQKESYISEVKANDLEKCVHFLGSFPGETMPHFFACVDGLIVSLKKDPIFGLTIPGKTQPYLACRKPIIASLDGEGARIIEEAQCGFTSAAENVEILAENVIALYRLSEEERLQMGRNSEKYFREHFDREMLIERLVKILEND